MQRANSVSNSAVSCVTQNILWGILKNQDILRAPFIKKRFTFLFLSLNLFLNINLALCVSADTM